MDLSAAIADTMKEAALEQAVRHHLADLPSLLGYHTHDSRRSHSGWPDWCFVGPRGVMWRELKAANGRTTAAQNQWIDALRRAGQDADVWRPADLMSGRIARELAALAGMRVAQVQS
jgi:hypothetical protein